MFSLRQQSQALFSVGESVLPMALMISLLSNKQNDMAARATCDIMKMCFQQGESRALLVI